MWVWLWSSQAVLAMRWCRRANTCHSSMKWSITLVRMGSRGAQPSPGGVSCSSRLPSAMRILSTPEEKLPDLTWKVDTSHTSGPKTLWTSVESTVPNSHNNLDHDIMPLAPPPLLRSPEFCPRDHTPTPAYRLHPCLTYP